VAQPRTLHVRCSTWDQVEVFHTRKLRRGKLLAMKVPFQTEIGAPVTLGLELPNQVVMAIEGVVLKASPIDGESKLWIEVELSGFTAEVIARIKAMAADDATPVDAPPAPPVGDTDDVASAPASGDERQLFTHLTNELRRLRVSAVHEVLGVGRAADADEIRRGWMRHVRRHHPDLVARHRAPAISHLAEELTILGNRAYDRLRAALVAEGRATIIGPTVVHPAGWIVGFEDIASQDVSGIRIPRTTTTGRIPTLAHATPPIAPPVVPRTQTETTPPGSSVVQGGEAFETRARAMLGEGDAGNAQEVLAAALCVYPRSKPLRSLYYVASAVAALQKGELMLATSQLETALAHHDQCAEAAAVLDHVRRHGGEKPDDVKRIFAR
jgi:hypothetical protein